MYVCVCVCGYACVHVSGDVCGVFICECGMCMCDCICVHMCAFRLVLVFHLLPSSLSLHINMAAQI